jgi:DNA-binding transcriptional MocR family regulator
VSAAGGRYVQVPLDIWTHGWLLTLSGRALALYLVLREASGGVLSRSATLSTSRKMQYGLSDDTWTRATRELEEAGLLETEPVFARATSKDEWGPKRLRQKHTLMPDAVLELGPFGTSSNDA